MVVYGEIRNIMNRFGTESNQVPKPRNRLKEARYQQMKQNEAEVLNRYGVRSCV